MVKGFLRSSDAIFQLSPGVTVIGREKCDLNIESPAIELQHAIVEYSDSEGCFVLQDLNTAHGTYVNDCRIQNAAVRLAPGDVIRFGYGGIPMELEVEDAPMVSYPPVQQRPAWGGPLRIINDHIPIASQQQQQQQHQQQQQQPLPYLNGLTDSTYPPSTNPSQLPIIPVAAPTQTSLSSTWASTVLTSSTNVVIPRPPRPRPSSAGSRRNSGGAGVAGSSPTNSPVPPRRVGGGWVSSAGARTVVTSQQAASSPGSRGSPVNDVMSLHEKEQRLLRMGDEINRLAVFESESQRKDGVIAQLRDEIEALTEQQHGQLVPTAGGDVGSHTVALKTRVKELEEDIHIKQLEINALREQMMKMRPESSDPMENVATLRSHLIQRDRDLTALRQDLERSKKDRSTANSLVTVLQRDLSNRDNVICRMRGEQEIVKRELRDKEVSLSAMTVKLMETEASYSRRQDEVLRGERSIKSSVDKLRASETRIGELTHECAAYKEDIEKVKKHVVEEKEMENRYKAERDHARSQLLEVQQSEQMFKADEELARKTLEDFRTSIMQTTFSAPGYKMPDTGPDTADDTIVETIKKVIDDRTDVKNKLRDMKEVNKGLEAYKKESKTNGRTLKQQIAALEKRLQEGGRTCGHLRNEIKLLSSITVDDSLQGIKDTLAMILQDELSWQQGYETTLDKYGIGVDSPSQGLAAFIADLVAKSQLADKRSADAKSKFDDLEKTLKQGTSQEVDRLKAEYQASLADALEKMNLEADQKLRSSIEEVRREELAKMEKAFKTEREQLREAEARLEEMQKELAVKDLHDAKSKSLESQLEHRKAEFRAAEEHLRQELASLRDEHQSDAANWETKIAAVESRHRDETATFREQVKQHSLTIVSLEDEIASAGKNIAASRAEVGDLQAKLADQAKTLQEARMKYQQLASKPQLPPKPIIVQQQQPTVDVKGMEKFIALLKKENTDLKRAVQDQQDTILGLRRDLAGASARLSDMTGELNERQKEELETNRALLRDQDAELTTQRQQLAKLSELVDKKTAVLDKTAKDLGTQKELVAKHKQESLMKGDELARLQAQLSHEQENSKRALEQVQQEGMITSEMSSIGAQCRGERHGQVIARQREALAELRSRIKGIETNRPPLPTQDQALQQVILLKKELAEMRAKQAEIIDQPSHQANPEALLDREVARARGQISTAASDAAIERSARIELQQGLEISEQSYLKLSQSVSNLLNLGEVSGQETMSHLPRDERDGVTAARANTLELIASRLRTLNQRLERKDELLRDYEKDLEKLRLAERLANDKAGHVETLANDLRGRSEEAHYLRETLRRTREGLDQEKRLNKAIKSKKTFHLENDGKNIKQTWPKHNCYEDEMAKAKKDSLKKSQKERMIRKSYELESLKAELSEKDQQLCDTTAKLINLENAVAIS